jgi:hypothetical protein
MSKSACSVVANVEVGLNQGSPVRKFRGGRGRAFCFAGDWSFFPLLIRVEDGSGQRGRLGSGSSGCNGCHLAHRSGSWGRRTRVDALREWGSGSGSGCMSTFLPLACGAASGGTPVMRSDCRCTCPGPGGRGAVIGGWSAACYPYDTRQGSIVSMTRPETRSSHDRRSRKHWPRAARFAGTVRAARPPSRPKAAECHPRHCDS